MSNKIEYYNPELEKQLIKLRFKRVWLYDKSGYWMEKSFTYKDLKFKLYCETDKKKCLALQIKTTRNYEDIKIYKTSILNVKILLNKYK